MKNTNKNREILQDVRKIVFGNKNKKDSESEFSMLLLVKYGSDEDKNILLKMDHLPNSVLEWIAKYGNDKHRDKIFSKKLYYTPTPQIFLNLAKYGNDKHRDKLLTKSKT